MLIFFTPGQPLVILAWSIRETAALLLGCNAIELAWRFLCSAEWHPFPVEHIGQPPTHADAH